MRALVLIAVGLVASGCTAIVDAGSYSVGGGEVCDTLSGSGCPDGQACFTSLSSGDQQCIPAGSVRSGMVCDAMDDCVRGATCIFHARDRGLCTDYCLSDDDCRDIEGSLGCNINSATDIGACFQGCDPSDPASCGAGVACYAMGTAGACFITGPAVLADPCGLTYDDACAPGFVCLSNTEGENRCFAQCGPGLPACPEGETCKVVLDTVRDAMAGEWGACSI